MFRRLRHGRLLWTALSSLALAASATDVLAESTLFVPQIADGRFSFGGESYVLRTAVALRNLSTTLPAGIELALFAERGEIECSPVDPGEQPFCLSLVQLAPRQAILGGRSRLFFFPPLPPGETLRLVTRADQPLASGWGKLQSNGALRGTATYQIFKGDDARPISQATVELAEWKTTAFAIDVNFNAATRTNTAIAISNPEARSAAQVTLRLKDHTGAVVGEKTVRLGGYTPAVIGREPVGTGVPNRLVRYLSELFPDQAAAGSMIGSLSVTSDQPLIAVALRQIGIEFIPVAVIPE